MKNTKTASVIATNISQTTGHGKHSVSQLVLDSAGIVGDRHHGIGNRQVCILGQESLERLNRKKNKFFKPGELGENITIAGIDLRRVKILDRLQIGEVVLEITQIGKKCHGDVCEIYREVGICVMHKECVFARVIHGGTIKPGDAIRYISKVLKILIITLSDRAAQGNYEDLSGPAAKELIEKFFSCTKWSHFEISNFLLPDDANALEISLKQTIAAQTDIVFTLGGTGIGPRDITPEVVQKVADKIIPGIMEHVRIKYGVAKPAALLSRSIAAIAKQTQIYAVPGSVRAVKEYLQEILPLIEHAIFMLYAIDAHY